MLAIKTILHPTDLSERSDFAFRLACSLAHDYGARLIVVHVAEPPMAVYGDGLVLPAPEATKEPLRAKLCERLPQDPQVGVEHRLLEGDAAIEILAVATEAKCDLIVMGTHGRRGLSRLLMGSVAEEVVRKAPCPVVTVKAPASQVRAAGETTSETTGSPAVASKG